MKPAHIIYMIALANDRLPTIKKRRLIMLGNFKETFSEQNKIAEQAEQAIEKFLFTGEITPENIKGKVFLLRNKDKFIDTAGDGGLIVDSLRGGSETYGGKQFALFYMGTDTVWDRHFFTMAQYDTGELIHMTRIGSGNFGRVRREYREGLAEYRLFYFEKMSEKVSPKAHSWRIGSMVDKYWDVANDRFSFEGIGNNDEQAWQLYHVRDFPVPKPLKKGGYVSAPTWDKKDKPTKAESFTYQTIGSTILPYFVRQEPHKWQSLGNGAYFKLVRQQRWSYKGDVTNNTSGDIDKEFTISSGWSTEKTKSFYASIGVSLTSTTSVTVGSEASGVSATQELSVSVSAEMGWEESTSNTISKEKTESTTYHIKPGKKVYFWQPEEKFILYKIDANGKETREGAWTIATAEVTNTEYTKKQKEESGLS